MKYRIGFLMLFTLFVSNMGFSKTDPNQNSVSFLETIKNTEMLNIDWDIQFETENGKKYRLALLAECEVVKSVDNLSDVATIVLPEMVMNEALNIENKVKRGDKVSIKLGYNNALKNEFEGFVKGVNVIDGSIKIDCEDALFLFRKGVADKHFEQINIKGIASYLTQEINKGYKVDCDYDISYEKFTIHQATAYDVLKKIKEQCKANMFFDTKNKMLHIHQPYTHKTGEVNYSMQKNIESSSLEFINPIDEKFEVTVESTDKNGNIQSYTAGTTGGDKVTIKVGNMDKKSIKELAENTLKEKRKAKYKGSFDTWLIPYVEPSYSANIKDEDYNRVGKYYIASVTTNVSSSGGKRTVIPGVNN